jgi:hypothetical protein
VCESMSLIEAQDEGVPVGIVEWKVCLRNTTNAMTEVDATCRMHAHVTILHVVKYYICYNITCGKILHMLQYAHVHMRICYRESSGSGECDAGGRMLEQEGGGGGGGTDHADADRAQGRRGG